MESGKAVVYDLFSGIIFVWNTGFKIYVYKEWVLARLVWELV